MKRYLKYIIVLIVFSTTACSSGMEDLSEEENGLIAEYVGGALLKHDKNYSEKLLISSVEPSDTPIQVTPIATQEDPKDTEKEEPSETTGPDSKYVGVEDIFADIGITMKFVKYGYFDDYPIDSSNSYFTLKSEDSEKILVLEFDILNQQKVLKKVDLVNSKIRYILSMNKKDYSPSITFLVNDLQYLKMDLPGQKTKRAVLVFEVPKQLETEKLQLKLLKGEKIALISMQ